MYSVVSGNPNLDRLKPTLTSIDLQSEAIHSVLARAENKCPSVLHKGDTTTLNNVFVRLTVEREFESEKRPNSE